MLASLMAIGACYFLGTANILADDPPPPACQDCDCKMSFAWVNGSDSYASGMKTQDTTPLQVLCGTPAQVKYCIDPPKPSPTNPVQRVDRYEDQNYSFTCTKNNNSRLVMEASVTDSGTRADINIIRQICVQNQGQ